MKNFKLILVEPVYRGNIGAVSRIMKNFSFSDLRTVGKIPSEEDKVLSVHAQDILDTVQSYDSLKNAISDLDKTVAVTRRVAKYKKHDFTPEELSSYLLDKSDQNIGLVFGRETYGLTREEEDLCDLRCYIPSNPKFPSLNLSQAVTVVIYELYKLTNEFIDQDRKYEPASKEDIDESVSFIMVCLHKIGFFNKGNEYQFAYTFRNTFVRANIGKSTLYKFRKIFERIMGIYFIKKDSGSEIK